MAKNSINFIKSKIEELPIPPNGRSYYYDKKVDGLLLQVTDSGSKSFQVRRKINGRSIRVTLGTYPGMTIEQAKKQAYLKLSEFAEGVNPNQKKKSERIKGVSLRQCFEDYLNARKNLKPLTIKDYKKVMRETFSDWLDKPLKDINRDMIVSRHKRRGQSSQARANNAMRVLRALFNFAMQNYDDEFGKPLFTDNPVARISHTRAWFDVQRRRNVIGVDQLTPWFRAVMRLKNRTARDYLLFLLFTGLRREEGAQLKWENVNFKTKTLTITDTKNHEPHKLPLTYFLMDLLMERDKSSEYVFPSDKSKAGYIVNIYRPVQEVRAHSGVHFTLHDLRRTFITIAEGMDISAYAVKRLINHKLKHDVTAGYIVHDVERLRKPMQRITDFILKAAAIKESAKIIELKEIKA